MATLDVEPIANRASLLVWNKGIAAQCDRRIPDEFPGHQYVTNPLLAGAMWSRRLPENLISDPAALFDIRDGELVWVRLSWLRSFVKQVLPHVRGKFVLVTGDSDSSVPSEMGHDAFLLLNSPNVLHWFTQNYDGTCTGEKISPLPIGIDFHSVSRRAVWGEAVSSPTQQEEALNLIRQALPKLENRIPKVYIDFAWQKGFGIRHYRRYHRLQGTTFRESRRQIAKLLSNNQLVFPQTTPLPRNDLWRLRGQYAFVLSPHGMGLDCHRTWEALALGHIVLVPSSALDPLYTDLPVVILKSWTDIRPENVTQWLARYRDKQTGCEKLTSRFWIKQMRILAKERLSSKARL